MLLHRGARQSMRKMECSETLPMQFSKAVVEKQGKPRLTVMPSAKKVIIGLTKANTEGSWDMKKYCCTTDLLAARRL